MWRRLAILAGVWLLTATCLPAECLLADSPAVAWRSVSPRDEIRPNFRQADNSLVIATDERDGLQGWWEKEFAVEGGRHYQFQVACSTEGVENRRRCVFPRIIWKDEQGNVVNRDEPVLGPYHPAGTPAESTPEYPREERIPQPTKLIFGKIPPAAANTLNRAAGGFRGTFRAPQAARQAVIELRLQWTANSQVTWSDIVFEPCDPPPARKVKLATVHYRPRGKSPEQNREEFAPLIEEAAAQKVDLLVLPETLTYFGTGRSYVDCAEPVPGPSTHYFGTLAKKHNLHLVVGLLERDQHLVYNVAVLIGPAGDVLGKYRKVCLPRGEADGGIAPGNEFPVFKTRFGKVGMMVCYDGFFPEPARELTENGAEVIAFPVAGCNPRLAAARACENQVYVISSTYTDVSQDWMTSAVFDHQGEMAAQATTWGSIAIAEVDLARPTIWAGLGDFSAEVHRHRPPSAAERVQAIISASVDDTNSQAGLGIPR